MSLFVWQPTQQPLTPSHTKHNRGDLMTMKIIRFPYLLGCNQFSITLKWDILRSRFLFFFFALQKKKYCNPTAIWTNLYYGRISLTMIIHTFFICNILAEIIFSMAMVFRFEIPIASHTQNGFYYMKELLWLLFAINLWPEFAACFDKMNLHTHKKKENNIEN